ncbi:hypothetical protein ACFOG5_10195 [Pedobacter fastidiosus]|uniref:Uncharacterized protein n=1 Tax=Pedobacter fastidiosus TaxID=2765361 RepID=A0ABR7KWJ7_9SPHI|nr:hypothetical protein [Pedobacter fastidiosus]MBC6112393.1 hypothetical protein [Pedobacter fastidiosus]
MPDYRLAGFSLNPDEKSGIPLQSSLGTKISATINGWDVKNNAQNLINYR